MSAHLELQRRSTRQSDKIILLLACFIVWCQAADAGKHGDAPAICQAYVSVQLLDCGWKVVFVFVVVPCVLQATAAGAHGGAEVISQAQLALRNCVGVCCNRALNGAAIFCVARYLQILFWPRCVH